MADADTAAMLHHKLRIVDQCIVRVSKHGGSLAVITHLFKTRDELMRKLGDLRQPRTGKVRVTIELNLGDFEEDEE